MNYIINILLIIIVITYLFKIKEPMTQMKVKLICNKTDNEYICDEQNDLSITIDNINNKLKNSKDYANNQYLKLQDNYNKQHEVLNNIMNTSL